MKKTNFTVSFKSGTQHLKTSKQILIHSFAVLLMCCFFTFTTNLQAQSCVLACHDVQVSVDMECEAEITVAMIGDTSSCLLGDFTVYVMTLQGDTIPTSPFVTLNDVGQTLKASVYDNESGNSCWSYITVQDKLAPIIMCFDDTISCTDIVSHPMPQVIEFCSGPAIPVLVDEDVEALCDPLYIKKITQYYTATDAAGNQSDTCSQVLLLKRIDFTEITWPDSFTIANGNAIQCTAPFPDVNGDGNPDPVGVGGTGVPMINGNPIYPDFNFACNSQTTFEDVNIGPIGCVEKIMRMWTVREWHCDGERDTVYFQLIEIADESDPILTCPEDVLLTTSHDNCDANFWLPVLPVTDACSGISSVTVSYPGGFWNQNGGKYVTLPVGENIITYTAYDDCLNSTECFFTVTVQDLTAPVPVCDEHTIISLTGYEEGGLTLVPAHVLDDGSYDECGPVTFEVIRMTSCIDFDWTTQGAGIDNDPNGIINSRDLGTVYRKYLPLSCCDVGNTIMVSLKVTDEAGNSNTCMVEVEVQDKLKPIISCPTDITISCELDYDLDNLAVFGSVVTSQAEAQEWCVYDPTNPYANVDGFVCGTDGVALDNCNLTITTDSIVTISNCGTGKIVRTFRATDPNGTSSCAQTITIKNFDPLQTQDIYWPHDFNGAECGLGTDPEDLPAPYNFPVITEDECDLVGVNYDDQVFDFVEGACFKILRTWQVIEWCLFEEYGGLVEGENYWVHQQVIKVTNADGPDFDTEQPTITECNDFDCGGLFIELLQTATDICTPDDELVWSYGIDLFNDFSINDGDNGFGNMIDASRTFPIGTHRVIYSFEDKCGNKTTREQILNIESCKAPQPICINGLSTDLMPIDTDGDGTADSGMITIWASDFDKGSLHACGLEVTVSFSEDPTDIFRVFDCSHVGVGQVPVQLYAHASNGLFAYCETYIIIQDNMNVCDGNTGGATGVISGEVNTEETDKVSNVSVKLEGSGLLAVNTSGNGTYTFPAMPLGGTYSVSPERDGDDKNGVSTLDLVRIQKHLLGIQTLQSPYLMIAADANNSKNVTAIDLIELRKLILGIYDELPENTSWRFVDENYIFPDPFNPWFEEFAESYQISPFTENMMDIDFVAVKVGDVNNTVVANAAEIEIRNASETLRLMSNDRMVTFGEQVELTFNAENFENIAGFQFTLNFDPSSLNVISPVAGSLPISMENFGLNRSNQGKITMSWNDSKGLTQLQSDELFTISFTAMKSGLLSDMIQMTSEVTSAEAYTANDEIMDVSLTFRGAEQATADFELFQNRPNPFSQLTTIAFNLPESMPATLTVYDLTGKQLKVVDFEGQRGYNEYVLNRSVLDATGVLYYQLAADGYIATRKMVIVK